MDPSLDDNDGSRTRKPVTNYHGIVEFEVMWDPSASTTEPTSGWQVLNPLKEESSVEIALVDGNSLRVWVRAIDIMGNNKTDSTYVQIDGSVPFISSANNSDHGLELNVPSGEYKHSTRYTYFMPLHLSLSTFRCLVGCHLIYTWLRSSILNRIL